MTIDSLTNETPACCVAVATRMRLSRPKEGDVSIAKIRPETRLKLHEATETSAEARKGKSNQKSAEKPKKIKLI